MATVIRFALMEKLAIIEDTARRISRAQIDPDSDWNGGDYGSITASCYENYE